MPRARSAAALAIALLLAQAAQVIGADLAGIEASIDQYRLKEAAAAVATAYPAGDDADADAQYLRARIALARYERDAAARAIAGCHARAAAARQRARCLEVEAELLAHSAAESNDLLEQVDSARTAQDLLARAADLDPDNVRVRMQRARNYRLLPWFVGGSNTRALRQVDAVAHTRPDLAAYARGIDAWYAGDDAQAIAELTAARRGRGDADAGYFLALAQARSGDAAAAVRTLLAVTASAPEHWEAWFALGRIAEPLAAHAMTATAALSAFVAGATAAPAKRLANAHFLLGRLAERAGDRDAAARAYRAALAAKPGHDDSRAALAALGSG